MKRKKERKKDYYTIVYCGIKNLNYSLKFHRFYRIFAYNGEKKNPVRVGRLFVANINLSFAGEKFDSHAKPHARTIRSGRRTVAEAVASR